MNNNISLLRGQKVTVRLVIRTRNLWVVVRDATGVATGAGLVDTVILLFLNTKNRLTERTASEANLQKRAAASLDCSQLEMIRYFNTVILRFPILRTDWPRGEPPRQTYSNEQRRARTALNWR
ncbi:hypothetical protein J6590_062624 [Homalodisca vitripennis]|nr:hypothetical protein J6590_062624 [Homalodisca vitripennis]